MIDKWQIVELVGKSVGYASLVTMIILAFGPSGETYGPNLDHQGQALKGEPKDFIGDAFKAMKSKFGNFFGQIGKNTKEKTFSN